MKQVILMLGLLLLGGCIREFPPQSFSSEDQALKLQLEAQTDYDSRLLLASMYFLHNYIDEADGLLQQLVAENPANPEAQAWYGANNCKKAGRAFPWLLGLDKLYRVHACLEQVDAAARQAPDDVTVQLIKINTGAEVNVFGALEGARETGARLEQKLKAQPDAYPPQVRSYIYLAMAKVEHAAGDNDKARSYLKQVTALNASPALVVEANALLQVY